MLQQEFTKLSLAKKGIRKAIQRKRTGLTLEERFETYPPYIAGMHSESSTIDDSGLVKYCEDAYNDYTVPEEVTTLRDYAFYDYTNLQRLNLKGTSVVELQGTKAFDRTTLKYITVPAGLLNQYKTANNWSQFADKIVTPNLIVNSKSWMNGNQGTNNTSSVAYTKSIITDSTAPNGCKALKVQMVNSTANAIGGMGVFFGYGTQLGLTNTTQLQQTIPVGTTFTYSFWAKCDSGNSIGFGAGAVCESQTHVSNTGFGNLTTSWRRHTVTFKQTRTDKLTACFYVTVPANSTQTFYLCGLKLEEGTVAGEYSSPDITAVTNLIEHEADVRTRTVEWFNALKIEDIITDRRI